MTTLPWYFYLLPVVAAIIGATIGNHYYKEYKEYRRNHNR